MKVNSPFKYLCRTEKLCDLRLLLSHELRHYMTLQRSKVIKGSFIIMQADEMVQHIHCFHHLLHCRHPTWICLAGIVICTLSAKATPDISSAATAALSANKSPSSRRHQVHCLHYRAHFTHIEWTWIIFLVIGTGLGVLSYSSLYEAICDNLCPDLLPGDSRHLDCLIDFLVCC